MLRKCHKRCAAQFGAASVGQLTPSEASPKLCFTHTNTHVRITIYVCVCAYNVSSIVLLTVQKGNKVLKIVEITAGYSNFHIKKVLGEWLWQLLLWHMYSYIYSIGDWEELGCASHMACKCGKLRHNKPQLKCEMQAEMAKEKNARKKIVSKALGKALCIGAAWQLAVIWPGSG